MEPLQLLPYPRSISTTDGQHTLAGGRLIVLQDFGPVSDALRCSAQRLQDALRQHAAVEWEVSATSSGPAHEHGAVLRLAAEGIAHPQGYALTITPEQITITAQAEPGLFYGICTLIQLLRQFGRQLPCLEVADSPDFEARGVMLDVSRDKVPTMETLFGLVDMLAGWKLNQLQLYTEHTFAYRNHPEVWTDASPLTGQEILELDAYCRARYIELVPNQNSFGHMHRWLIHERYAPLAEIHGSFQAPWGPMEGPFSLYPGDPGSLELIRSLYDELLPHFSSPLFNVGCDETVDLGQGRSKEDVAQRGAGRVYLDFLLKIYEEVKARGRTMQFWGDIITHHAELIPELPKDVIALEWGYEADHPFAVTCPQFAASGIPFYVCPGTSSWCTIAGRTDNALDNLRNAAENGLKHGAIGYLITDWGDRGHWQFLPVSYLGFAAGAAYAWALEANRDRDVAEMVSTHAFDDPTGVMGRVAYELGSIYREVGLEVPNSSTLFWILQLPLGARPERMTVEPAALERTITKIERVIGQLGAARMRAPDATLIAQEYTLAARMLRHACLRGLLAVEAHDTTERRRELDADLGDIVHHYRRLWLARNRPGGLQDSVAHFERARADYRV